MISPILGIRIKELRQEQNLTLEQFGQIVGIKKSALSLIENGKGHASLDVVYLAAKHFEVSIDYLLGRTNIREINK